ncbi:MAG: hypothetical protein R2776_05265 [Flavobacteriaceae bacterium]|nr:hypothetical protein [Flavobacteriaceae bacterium]
MKAVLYLLCLMAFSSQAQELFWEYGQALTSFDYKNSQGNELDNLQGKTFSFVNVGTRIPLFKEALQFTGSFNWDRFGALGSDGVLNNYFDWETTYFGAILGLDSKVIGAGNFSWHLQAGAGPEFLVQGSQTLNNQVFDLTEQEDFNGAVFLFRLGSQFEYQVLDGVSLALSYHFGKSSNVGSDTSEELSFKAHQLGLKMYFNIASGKNAEEEKINSTNQEN